MQPVSFWQQYLATLRNPKFYVAGILAVTALLAFRWVSDNFGPEPTPPDAAFLENLAAELPETYAVLNARFPSELQEMAEDDVSRQSTARSIARIGDKSAAQDMLNTFRAAAGMRLRQGQAEHAYTATDPDLRRFFTEYHALSDWVFAEWGQQACVDLLADPARLLKSHPDLARKMDRLNAYLFTALANGRDNPMAMRPVEEPEIQTMRDHLRSLSDKGYDDVLYDMNTSHEAYCDAGRAFLKALAELDGFDATRAQTAYYYAAG